jgi:hypothetical protein
LRHAITPPRQAEQHQPARFRQAKGQDALVKPHAPTPRDLRNGDAKPPTGLGKV